MNKKSKSSEELAQEIEELRKDNKKLREENEELTRRVEWWKKACKTAGPSDHNFQMALTYRGPGQQLVHSYAGQFKRLREKTAPWEEAV